MYFPSIVAGSNGLFCNSDLLAIFERFLVTLKLSMAHKGLYSSQRQLRLDLELWLVRWLVRPWTLFLENRSKDFLAFWHKGSAR